MACLLRESYLMMKRGHLPERAAGWAQLSDEGGEEEMPVCGGGDGGIMCGEAGCVHCGFTSATSRPLFKTIINCSIIQMIFTRANYTGPRPAEKMA